MLDQAKTANSSSTLLAFYMNHLSRLGSCESVGLPSALPHMHHSIAMVATSRGPIVVHDLWMTRAWLMSRDGEPVSPKHWTPRPFRDSLTAGEIIVEGQRSWHEGHMESNANQMDWEKTNVAKTT
jgi:hypothetical protein